MFSTRLLELERQEETGNELSDWDLDADGRLTLAEVVESLSLNEMDEVLSYKIRGLYASWLYDFFVNM